MTDEERVNKAIKGMLCAAYGIDPNAKPLTLKERVKIWHDENMSMLDIGKQMYGTILLPQDRAQRDAYVKGLMHGMSLQEYKTTKENEAKI